ncbi:MAG: fumarylacetoacetate hydrolase family protein [Pseudomonadota bacterium]
MKLLSFRYRGTDSYGAIVAGGIVDLGLRLRSKYRDLRAVLEAGALEELGLTVEGAGPDLREDQVEYLPVIAHPGKIICVGINYRSHAAETGREMPPYPNLFLRLADSQVGHRQPIVKPNASDQLDFEGELAAIVGRPGRRIAREAALSHIAGYSCYNDASVRDWQFHNQQNTPGKNFHCCGAFGPAMTTADEIPDPTRLALATHLNGVEVQRATTDQMIYDIPAIISYASAFTPLAAGDVIVTGTPAGVGFTRQPPLFMKPGDTVEVTITGIGTLSNPVAAEAERP